MIEAAGAATGDTVRSEKVKLLLDKGAKIEARDIVEETALIKAASIGATMTVELLLRKSAEIEGKDRDGSTPLVRAATFGHAQTVKLLLSNKAKVDAKDKIGRTALMWTVLWGNIETVQTLLEGGANVQIKDNDGSTALDFAIHAHKTAIVQLLQTYMTSTRKPIHAPCLNSARSPRISISTPSGAIWGAPKTASTPPWKPPCATSPSCAPP